MPIYMLTNDLSDGPLLLGVAQNANDVMEQLEMYMTERPVSNEEKKAIHYAVHNAVPPNDGLLGTATSKVTVGGINIVLQVEI